MIDYLTKSVLSTSSWTRIDTFAFNAGLIWNAVGIENTFRTASNVRIADKISLACAASCSVSLITMGVCTTRIWITGRRLIFHYGLGFGFTLYERVSNEANQTDAARDMTHDPALGIDATNSWTRIFTFFVDASQMTLTFTVTDAFRSAIWRTSNITIQACTRWWIVFNKALGIGTTWWRYARIYQFMIRCFFWKLYRYWDFVKYVCGLTYYATGDKGIAGISRTASTYWIVVDNLTVCGDATRS